MTNSLETNSGSAPSLALGEASAIWAKNIEHILKKLIREGSVFLKRNGTNLILIKNTLKLLLINKKFEN